MPLPLALRGGGGDGDAPLLLLLHPVHDGGALVDLTDLVRDAGVEEDALGRRRLTGVDVRHDADIADLGEGSVYGSHFESLLRSRRIAGKASLTSGSARRPCWTPPSCGCPRGASPKHRARCWRRAARS